MQRASPRSRTLRQNRLVDRAALIERIRNAHEESGRGMVVVLREDKEPRCVAIEEAKLRPVEQGVEAELLYAVAFAPNASRRPYAAMRSRWGRMAHRSGLEPMQQRLQQPEQTSERLRLHALRPVTLRCYHQRMRGFDRAMLGARNERPRSSL